MAIEIGRVLDRLDSYLKQEQYQAAERHLRYWLDEANALGDTRGAFAVLNEMVGFYRKQVMEKEGLAACHSLMELIGKMGIADTAGAATAYLNIATAYKSFERTEDALPLYEKARAIYERDLDASDSRLAGLYNNMALAFCERERFAEAMSLYEKALQILEKHPGSEPEQAVTYLNLADLYQARLGSEAAEDRVEEALQHAKDLLDAAWEGGAGDGNYAFVASKCAPAFSHYGHFVYASTLARREQTIRSSNASDDN